MPIDNDMLGAQAAHGSFINRLAQGNANKVTPFLEDAFKYISKRLDHESGTIKSRARLRAIQKDIDSRLTTIYAEWETIRDGDIYSVGGYEAGFQQDLLNDLIPNYDFTRPTDQQIIAAAKAEPLLIGQAGSAVGFETLLDEWTPKQIALVNNVIQSGFMLGETTQQISRRIRNDVMSISKRDSDTIVRTTTNHIANQAKLALYEENNDIVTGVKWVSVLDRRTTQICASRDQTEYKIGKAPPIPAHYNCRSMLMPVIDKRYRALDSKGTRAANGSDGGGKTSSNKQYYDWLKSQSASFQDEMLGKTKGKIFRDAGLTPEEFRNINVDRMGQPLTIKELIASDKRIRAYVEKAAA